MVDKESEIARNVQEKMVQVAGEIKEEVKEATSEEATSGVIELFVLALVGLLAMVALSSLLLFVAIF